ncbi:uncharacterized protein NEMAJ01_0711 [Nematocida major]|uniref:uncharacterized protein n=1 Tax=Nematocida major TaxID=1912982 RepID=UPI0020076C05|nr:uncharacterized protein NEMAJ01_0711 [Nematocida major]KAH9385815.1 hypothetical protein NEMAJ01_0711 [Nematocida major]
MNTEKSATVKINVERTIENYKQNAICEEDKVLAPVPTINWPSFLSKIFIGSTHLEFQKEAEENWKNKIQVLSRILEMNTICFIMQSKEKCAIHFRNAVLGSVMDDELTGKEALEKCAKTSEFIQRNLTEDKIDEEPTVKAFIEAETAKMIHVIEYISKFSESDAKNYIEHLINITTRRFNLLALRDKHYGICPLDRFCSRYEQKNSISSSDDIYSLEELYTLEKDGKLLLDEALEETFSIICRDFSSENFFRTVKEMEAMDISPETMKRIRSINYHNRDIVCEQEFVYQMLYMERSRADLERNANLLDDILDVKKSNPIGADIFRKSVDSMLISLVIIADDKEEVKEKLNNKRIEIERNLDRTQNMLNLKPYGTEEANEMYTRIESCQSTIASIDEALNLFNDYSGLDLVQKEAIWAKIESYSRHLQVKIKDFDFLRSCMIYYEENGGCFSWDISSDDDEVENDVKDTVKDDVEDDVESNRPFDQSASHLNNNAAPVNIQQETIPVTVETVPVNPEEIDHQNSKIENLLQVLLCLFLSLFIVSSSMAIYEEIQSQA